MLILVLLGVLILSILTDKLILSRVLRRRQAAVDTTVQALQSSAQLQYIMGVLDDMRRINEYTGYMTAVSVDLRNPGNEIIRLNIIGSVYLGYILPHIDEAYRYHVDAIHAHGEIKLDDGRVLKTEEEAAQERFRQIRTRLFGPDYKVLTPELACPERIAPKGEDYKLYIPGFSDRIAELEVSSELAARYLRKCILEKYSFCRFVSGKRPELFAVYFEH